MKIFGFNFGKKKGKFITHKSDLTELSDAEKGMIEEHRRKMLDLERDHEAMQTTMRNEMERVISIIPGNANEPVYLYDILGGWSGGNNEIRPAANVTIVNTEANIQTSNNGIDGTLASGTEIKVENQRQYKPIEVFEELERVPDLISLEKLDDKIKVLEIKKDLVINNYYAKNEMIDMVERLKNRKKYDEFKDFFEQFENTTTEKIVELISRYKLVLKTSDLFIAAFPDEAVLIMKTYTDNTVALCGKKPLFYVIAEEEMFKQEYKKKDPILLAQSPFGCYWQILGAWDKEMILLQEL